MKQPRSYYAYVVIDKRLPVNHEARVLFVAMSRQVAKQQSRAFAQSRESEKYFRVRRCSMRLFES